MKYAGWFSTHPDYKNHTDPVRHISFVFDSFPLICLEVNSNPSETHRSKRASMMIRIDGYLLYQESWSRVFYCQHRPALEPTFNRFTVSRHRCCTITLQRWYSKKKKHKSKIPVNAGSTTTSIQHLIITTQISYYNINTYVE